jgi:hypothetical protein
VYATIHVVHAKVLANVSKNATPVKAEADKPSMFMMTSTGSHVECVTAMVDTTVHVETATHQAALRLIARSVVAMGIAKNVMNSQEVEKMNVDMFIFSVCTFALRI